MSLRRSYIMLWCGVESLGVIVGLLYWALSSGCQWGPHLVWCRSFSATSPEPRNQYGSTKEFGVH
jgi:hypothetical protein